MATFDDIGVGTSSGGTTPDFGAQKKTQPTVRVVKFGDGYEQRLAYGVNTKPQNWTLRWSACSNSDADAIEAFFEARGAVESFDWTPIEQVTTYKFVCREWQREHQYADINVITATFEQVFEP